MKLKNLLLTNSMAIILATILTLVVSLESGRYFPWSPYFVIYAVLTIIIFALTRIESFSLGKNLKKVSKSFKTSFKENYVYIILFFLLFLFLERLVFSFAYEKILEIFKVSDDPFYSLELAINLLAQEAALKFGWTKDTALDLYGMFIICWAPFGEEMFYRGYMQEAMSQKNKKSMAAIIVPSLFFGIRHITHFIFLYPDIPWVAGGFWIFSTFVYGIFMGFLYRACKSVWPCIIMHLALNLIELYYMN